MPGQTRAVLRRRPTGDRPRVRWRAHRRDGGSHPDHRGGPGDRDGALARAAGRDACARSAPRTAGSSCCRSTRPTARPVALVRYDPADRGAVHRVALPVPARRRRRRSCAGDAVYLLGAGGSLLAVDTRPARRQAELWRLETGVADGLGAGARRRAGPVLLGRGRTAAGRRHRGGRRCCGADAPRLTAAEPRTRPTLPAPVAADGRVSRAAPDGTVFAVDGLDRAGW